MHCAHVKSKKCRIGTLLNELLQLRYTHDMMYGDPAYYFICMCMYVKRHVCLYMYVGICVCKKSKENTVPV